MEVQKKGNAGFKALVLVCECVSRDIARGVSLWGHSALRLRERKRSLGFTHINERKDARRVEVSEPSYSTANIQSERTDSPFIQNAVPQGHCVIVSESIEHPYPTTPAAPPC